MNSKRGKTLSLYLVGMMIAVILLSACGGKNSDSPSASTDSGERSKVTVWYLWGGAEGEVLEEIIRDFNESQDKYFVEGLSVPDEQKIKVRRQHRGGQREKNQEGFHFFFFFFDFFLFSTLVCL